MLWSRSSRRAGRAVRRPREAIVKKLLLSSLPLLALALGFAAVALLLAPHLTLQELSARRAELRSLVSARPAAALGVYVLVYAGLVAVSFPGALVMTLTGGFLFGGLVGGLAAAVGVTLGAVLMFLAALTSLGGVARALPFPGGFLETVRAGLQRHPFLYLLSLRLMPAAPIWIVNLGAALARPPFGAYCAATALGVLPSSLVYAFVGAGLDQAFASGRPVTPASLLNPPLAAGLVALGILALAPALAARLLKGRGRALPSASR